MFESLKKNEFEKSLKKKEKKSFPSPLSLLFFFQPVNHPRPSASSSRARRLAQAGPAPLPRQPSSLAPFFSRQTPTGGARPSGVSPTFDRRVSRPPSRRRPLPAASPAPLTSKRRNQARNEALPSFPLFNRSLPSLIPSPLIIHQGRGH
jgi:hypothetical protein